MREYFAALLLLLVVFSAPTPANCLVADIIHNEHMGTLVVAQNLSMAVVQMLKPSFIRDREQRTYNLYAFVQEPQRKLFFGDVMENVQRQLGATIKVRLGMNLAMPGDHERHYNVLLVDSFKSLRKLYRKFEDYHLYINGYFIIVLHTFDSAHYYDVIFEIFELNWLLGAIDVNVLVFALANLVLLYSIFPFNNFHCKGLAPTLKNRFISSHWQNENFFPDKLADLHGCPLICASWEFMPYFQLATTNIEGKKYTGIEGHLLNYLSLRMNFKLLFDFLDEKENIRILNDENGLFKELFNNGTDFVMGALRYKPVSLADPYAPTNAYYLSSLYFIVNSNSSPYTPFGKLFLPFAYEIWCVIAVIFVSGALISLLNRLNVPHVRNFILGRGNRTPLYNMYVLSLGGSLPRLPRRNFARYVLLLWLIATMVLRCAYQAFMFHFIKSNIGAAPPNTIDGLLRQPAYRLLMTDIVRHSVRDLPRIYGAAQSLNATEMESFELLRQPDARLAILTPYEYFDYYKRSNPDGLGDFHVVPQKVLMQQLSIYMRSNSVLLHSFNRYILDYINSGLMNKWENVLFMRHSPTFADDEVSSQVVTLPQLYGAVYLWLIGNMLSLIALLYELVAIRMNADIDGMENSY